MKYFIVGNGDYAKMMSRYLKNTSGIEILGFTVEKNIISEKTIDGFRVISDEDLANNFNVSECRLVMGIGYRNMNKIKENEFKRYKSLGFSFDNYIHPTAIIEKNVVLGEANNIFEGVIIQEGVSIGDANLIYAGALISHESNIGNYNSLSVKSCVAGCCTIGNNCFLGANSTVRDNIRVADYTLLGAGAYLDKDTKEYDVVASQKPVLLEGKSSLEFI